MSRQVYFVVVTSDFQNNENFDMGTVNADPNETIAALKEKVAAEIGFPKMKFKVYADKSTSLALNATVDKHGSDPANALMVQLIENRSTGGVDGGGVPSGDQSSRIVQMLQGLTERFESTYQGFVNRFDGLEGLDARVLGSRRSTADWAQEINSCICDRQKN
mmetsp:Transcript_45192/g.94646  ORF Transcript_45192/g.94646 Transcript_45192/m.94646 type:complete len:162 (-) Transcript_45192:402-887(-)